MFEKLSRAMQFREPLRKNNTDALRLVDGPGDGFEDLEIEDFAGHWLVQTRSATFPAWLLAARSERAERGETPGPPPAARSIYWKKLGDKASPSGGGASPLWQAGEKLSEPFIVQENGVSYGIDFTAGYSQGIFLDQRPNRARLRELAAGTNSLGQTKSVLNCFAYTCAFGVCAALGGAHTVNLDLSRAYLDWGRRNYALNGLDPAAHEFLYGDVFDWLKRLAKKSRRFDAIVLDPPTFSRDEKGRVFRVEHDFPELVRSAARLLHPGGTLFCSTNQRTLWLESFRALITAGLPPSPPIEITHTPMPPDFRGEQYLKALWVKLP